MTGGIFPLLKKERGTNRITGRAPPQEGTHDALGV